MEAVILAAGKGTRLHPITLDTPKAMVLVNGKPMLQIIIEQFRSLGVQQFTIVVHYLKERIIDYFGDGSRFGVTIHYAIQQEMNGSAKAVLTAEPFIRENKFFVVASDSLFETGLLQRIITNHPTTDGVFTSKEVTDGRRFGILVTEGKKVVQVIEKPEHPPTNLANFSVYLLPREIFTACKEVHKSLNGEYWITDAIQLLIDRGKIFEYEICQDIIDIGTHEQLAEAQELAKELTL